MRQESVFDPRATSGAGARGLMQVLPAVGERMAHSRGYHDWDPVLLYQPEVSLDFGTGHLIAALRRYREPAHALAAYNAGSSRVDRWLARPGATTDPELFIERIPYVETRNYVRAVLRNWWMYEALYFGGRP
ncbi:MAG: lytic transglycosylase domain-containing protein [Gemmatimonadota bacterium]